MLSELDPTKKMEGSMKAWQTKMQILEGNGNNVY